MFGLIERIKQARAERLRRKKLMEEQDERIERGFAELRTALGLVAQAANGLGPRGNVVRIGDGFFVERTDDGKERTVFIENNQEELARRGEELTAIHRAVLDRYAAKVDEVRLRAESYGYTKDHPVVDALSKHAAAARMDFPNPWAPNPEIPQVEIPRLDITGLTLPELPEPPRNP